MNGQTDDFWGTSSDGKFKVHRVAQPSPQRPNSAEHLLALPDLGDNHRERSLSSQKHRKHRSLSSPRTEGSSAASSAGSSSRIGSSQPVKPKKPRRYLGSGSSSLTSIPNAIKLSMLNSGLLSVGEIIDLFFPALNTVNRPPATNFSFFLYFSYLCHVANSRPIGC